MGQTKGQSGGGFTLAESLLAATILAMAVTALTMPFTAGARNEQSDGRRTTAVSLASELMEEILSRPFNDPDGPSEPGPEVGEATRGDFDNIDDYDGYSETAGNVSSPSGSTSSDASANGLSRNVSASYVYISGQDTSAEPTFIRITVEIRYDGQPVTTLTRLAYAM